jgi:hypothetical protein
MKDNNSDLAMSGYSKQAEVVSGFTFLVTGIIKKLGNFAIRLRDEQSEARRQANRKRAMLRQVHQESSKRMPLEKLIRMGFYHF